MKKPVGRAIGLIAACLALLTASAVPSHAGPAIAVTGGGAVQGSVSITSTGGVDLTTRATTYQFTPIDLRGAFVATDGTNTLRFAGQVTTSAVNGGSAAENTASASGTVGSFSFNNVGADITGAGTSISGTLSGNFVRVGPTVVVTLAGNATISSGSISVSGAIRVVVTAVFAPTSGNGLSPTVPTGTPITQATFIGDYAVEGPF